MSEENKNRNKDKGKQRNIARKYDTSPKHNMEVAEESEFVNIHGKKNKRNRRLFFSIFYVIFLKIMEEVY